MGMTTTQIKTPQQQLQEKLQSLGIPFVDVHCYGSQVMITSQCETTARQWASVVKRFTSGKVRVTKSLAYNKTNNGTVMNRSSHFMWLTGATV